MKSIDLFEALNDIPADILLSAEARYTAEPQRRIDRRSGLRRAVGLSPVSRLQSRWA